MRVALHDATPLYRDAPEAREIKASTEGVFRGFARELLPKSSGRARELAADLIKTTLSAVGKSLSESGRPPAEIEASADALADMYCAYLGELRSRPARRSRPAVKR